MNGNETAKMAQATAAPWQQHGLGAQVTSQTALVRTTAFIRTRAEELDAIVYRIGVALTRIERAISEIAGAPDGKGPGSPGPHPDVSGAPMYVQLQDSIIRARYMADMAETLTERVERVLLGD